jgi:hypothetical protein
MEKEINDQCEAGHWHITHRSKVPEGATILPGVWSMKRKRRLRTGEVYKWKSRLTLDGSKETKGKDFWDTYAPVVAWPIIRWVLTMTLLNNWKTRQLDYVLAFPQAERETEHTYMKIPKGFHIPNAELGEYLLKVEQNIYGGRAAGRAWYLYLEAKLKTAGFVKSNYDDCLFYRGRCIYILYTDDSILAGPTDKELDDCITAIKAQGLDITVEGDLADFLGVEIKRESDGTIHLTQPHLIESILKDVRLNHPSVSTKQTPAATSKILGKHPNSDAFDGHFNYRSVIGKLNFLEKSTRPDIAYAVHQCARHCANPKKEHGEAVTWLCRYLAGTQDKGLILHPNKSLSFDCYVDADFAGNWIKDEADDIDTARSRAGWVIMFAGCPITWASKLQTIVALSSTESEYISASMALRETIVLLNIAREARNHGFTVKDAPTLFHCRIFEDNEGALEMLRTPRFRPRTKHVATKFHHFQYHVNIGDITPQPIDTMDQPADLLTKASMKIDTFRTHRQFIMGWH